MPVIVCLGGFPGVGKLTIANALAPELNAKIVDNHWINDPILGVAFDFSSSASCAARRSCPGALKASNGLGDNSWISLTP
jgi:hypothetical protein